VPIEWMLYTIYSTRNNEEKIWLLSKQMAYRRLVRKSSIKPRNNWNAWRNFRTDMKARRRNKRIPITGKILYG
jgi:hypothetical protein